MNIHIKVLQLACSVTGLPSQPYNPPQKPMKRTLRWQFFRQFKITVHSPVGFDKLSPQGSDLFVSRKFEITEQVLKLAVKTGENPPNQRHPRSILVGGS